MGRSPAAAAHRYGHLSFSRRGHGKEALCSGCPWAPVTHGASILFGLSVGYPPGLAAGLPRRQPQASDTRGCPGGSHCGILPTLREGSDSTQDSTVQAPRLALSTLLLPPLSGLCPLSLLSSQLRLTKAICTRSPGCGLRAGMQLRLHCAYGTSQRVCGPIPRPPPGGVTGCGVGAEAQAWWPVQGVGVWLGSSGVGGSQAGGLTQPPAPTHLGSLLPGLPLTSAPSLQSWRPTGMWC